MDGSRRISDEEMGEVDLRGEGDAVTHLNHDEPSHDENSRSVILCTSPTSATEKAHQEVHVDLMSNLPQSKISLLKRFFARWLPNPQQKEDMESNIMVQPPGLSPNGYPRLAAFLDSDDNFMLYRRFGYLQARVLLEKQDDLRQLEGALKRLDEDDIALDEDSLRSRGLFDLDDIDENTASETDSESVGVLVDQGEDNETRRKKLMRRIATNLQEYGELLTTAQALVAMNKPTSGEKRSVRNWLDMVEPVKREDKKFIQYTEDLVTLRPGREHAWLDASVESVVKWCKVDFIQNMFKSKAAHLKSVGSDNGVRYFTRERIELVVILLITLMILALLIVPIWLLYHFTTASVIAQTPRATATCIGVLLVFTLAFSACISLFTRAKRHEILAAAAGYCAVLVVFLGNINGGIVPAH